MGFKKIISSLLAISLLASFCTTAGINSPVYDVGASSGNLLSANSSGANQSEISAQVRSLQHDISSENLLYKDMSDTNFSEDSMHAERFPIGEYREMAEIAEHKLIFSVVEHCKKGFGITYIDENSELCMKYSLTNVSVVYEKLKETDDYEDVYCVFYEAYTAADDVWTIVDSMAEDEKIFSAEPDYIYTSADIGEFEHMQNLLDTETEDGTEGVTEENNPLETEYSYNCTHLESVNALSAWMSLINNGIDPGADTVVAVIDSGVDYTHEDLSRNIWINTDEIPDNGIDDDGNGYIDDCIGVDFAENDMDPMDDNGHGTHVAGTIAMQGNNGGGIGVAFDSKIMCIKAASGTGKLINSDIVKAIKYAADNGADVINMSFGGSDKSYVLETVLEDAYSKCILVASAGNDGKSTACYPGGYDYVIGVMATDDKGKLTDFSNWDANPNSDFEYDIAAPGYKVYSTIPGNKYARLSGTSMAAPVVSGAAALLRSYYRDKNIYSSRFIAGQLVGATKNTTTGESYQPSYPFLNIFDSMTESPVPEIIFKDYVCIDKGVNGEKDDIIQPGETVDIGFTVKNRWGVASGVKVSLVDVVNPEVDVKSPYVEIINNEVELDPIGTFTEADNGFEYTNGLLTGVSNPLTFKVSDDAPNNTPITLYLVASVPIKEENGKIIYRKRIASFSLTVLRGEILKGNIRSDKALTKDKYWIIEDAVRIHEGVTVNVEAGTKIQFGSNIEQNPYIQVDGRFICEGTADDPIEITSYAMICIGNVSDNNIQKILDNDENEYFVKLSYVNIENIASAYFDDLLVEFAITEADHCIFNSDNLETSVYMREVLASRFKGFENYNLYTSCFESNLVYKYMGLKKIEDFTKTTYKNNLFLDSSYSSRSTNARYIDEEDIFKNNAVLVPRNRINISQRVFDSQIGSGSIDISGNYWGAEDAEYVKKLVYDNDRNVSLIDLNQEPFLTLSSNAEELEKIYPFMTEAYLTTEDGQVTDAVTPVEKAKMHIKFNRDMNTDIQPLVTYGGSEPYTDYTVLNGEWITPREWNGDILLSYYSDEDDNSYIAALHPGTMYIRSKGAVAADNSRLVTGDDSGRFSFKVIEYSLQSVELDAVGVEGACKLNCSQDEFDTFMGYNIYRSESYDASADLSDQNFEIINTRSVVLSSELPYLDRNVEAGKDYYYYFTIVDTDMREVRTSGVVKCTPLVSEPPVIIHEPVADAESGADISVSADVTDNYTVSGVTLCYKSIDSEDWNSKPMDKSENTLYIAKITAEETAGKDILYYISASDGINTANSGTAENPYTIKIKAYGRPVFSSVTIKEDIGLNVFVDINPEDIDSEETYMLFSVPGETEKVKVALNSENVYTAKDSKQYYAFSCDVPARRMTEKIRLQFVASGQEYGEYEYSVREYAEKLLSEKGEDDKLAPLVKSMLNYGAYAQKYFNYNTDNLANEQLNEVDKALDTESFEKMIANEGDREIDGEPEKIKFVGSSLLLRSKITLRYYFEIPDGEDISGYTFVNKDFEVTYEPQSASRTIIENGIEAEKQLYYVDVDGILAGDFVDKHTIIAKQDGNEVLSVTNSVNSYIKSVYENNEINNEPGLKDLLAALYLYGIKAAGYVNE